MHILTTTCVLTLVHRPLVAATGRCLRLYHHGQRLSFSVGDAGGGALAGAPSPSPSLAAAHGRARMAAERAAERAAETEAAAGETWRWWRLTVEPAPAGGNDERQA